MGFGHAADMLRSEMGLLQIKLEEALERCKEKPSKTDAPGRQLTPAYGSYLWNIMLLAQLLGRHTTDATGLVSPPSVGEDGEIIRTPNTTGEFGSGG